jgi:GGDEF domain-containing protein
MAVASCLLKAQRARAMTQMRFYDAASGLLTPEAFSFMVTHLLRHAERTQEFLTLVVFVAERASRDAIEAADEWVVSEIARLIRQAIRETDLLGRTREGMLALMLAGIDVERASGVIERLTVLLARHGMAPGLEISVGAACCPTHAVSVDELMQHALSRRTRGGQGRKEPPTL